MLYLSSEWEDKSKGVGRKISNILSSKNIECVFVKKNDFSKKVDTLDFLNRILANGDSVRSLRLAETERPLSFNCLECIFNVTKMRGWYPS